MRRWLARDHRRPAGPVVRRLFPGDGRVWVAAGVVLAALGVYALTVLLGPREELAGTNSVGLVAAVDRAEAGERVCTQVRVPPDAAIVQVAAGLPDAPESTLRATLRLDGGERLALEPLTVAPGLDYKSFPVAPAPETRSGDLCLSSRDSGIDLGGAAVGHNANERPLRLGERERPDVGVSVRFLRSADTTTLLAALASAPGRADAFRPGPVGSWLYWLIPLLVLPALAYAGLRLLATAGERRPRRLALALAAIAFGVSACWALTTPMYQAPDESEHFAYAQHLAEAGAVPERAPGSRAAYSLEQGVLLQALRHAGSIQMGLTRPRWLEADEAAWRAVDRDLAGDDGGGYTVSAHSHSPLYYGLLAPAYALGGGGDLTWRLTLMRLVTALLACVVTACAVLTVRELLPRHPVLWAAAGLLVAFQPVAAFMGGAVNNDSAVNAGAALALYLVVRALRRGLTVRLGIAIGAALVALPLAKIVGYGVVPAVVLGLLVAALRRPRAPALGGLAAAGVTVGVLALAWTQVLVPAVTSTGGTLVNIGAARPADVALFRDPLLVLDYFVQTFLPPVRLTGANLSFGWPFYDIYIQGAFGMFGWAAIGMPALVYQVVLAVALVLLALAAVAAVRRRDRVRREWAPALVLAVAALGVVALVAAAYATPTPRAVPAEQGRYGFPALVPMAALAAFACLGAGRRWAPAAAGALAGAMIALGLGGWLQAFAAWYT